MTVETSPINEVDERIREELIGGKVSVLPWPSMFHSVVVQNIYYLFREYLGHRCCAFMDHVDVHLTDDNIFIPDVTVVCDQQKMQWDGVYGAPDLVVEILSPCTERNDRSVKKAVYERCGVREYWIVNPFSMEIEQYMLENGAFVLRDVYMKYQDAMKLRTREDEWEKMPTEFQCGIFEDLTVRLDDVFRGVEDIFP